MEQVIYKDSNNVQDIKLKSAAPYKNRVLLAEGSISDEI